MASKRLLLYATDAYKLSSLLLRRVFLTKPSTLTAYREKTRQLLLDQSRPSAASSNVAAVKLLEWDREWNLVQYYGVQEYAKRWWSSKQSWSLSGSSQGGSCSVNKSEDKRSSSMNKNVARVAFMITSEQRHKLSTKLGYSSQDIRSFKPIEALLLLEHGVKKESEDYRVKLKELMDENDRLMKNQHDTNDTQQYSSKKLEAEKSSIYNDNHEKEISKPSNAMTADLSLSPDEAQQTHAKPDVALALLSVRDDEKNHREDKAILAEKETRQHDIDNFPVKSDNSNESATMPSSEGVDAKETKRDGVSPIPYSSASVSSVATVVDVTSHDSEQLHMKPDVAAAILSSKYQKEQQQQQKVVDGELGGDKAEDDGPCWYEVIERLPPKIGDDDNKNTNYEDREQVIALFPTKKEALECLNIKESFRRKKGASNSDGERGVEDSFFVRRRWNV